MTRQALRYNAVNLAQDFPDFPTSSGVKQTIEERPIWFRLAAKNG
jgi:hypothetical protein